MLAGDDLRLIGFALTVKKETRRLDSAVVGIAASRREKEMIDRWIASLGQLLGQLNGRNIRVADVRSCKCQLLHLPHGGVCQFLPPVAKRHVSQTRQPVDELPPVRAA